MPSEFFDYELPPGRIAQEPLAERDQARLLVLGRDSAEVAHHVFADLPALLNPRDLLILNDTRVLPARLRGRRPRTGGCNSRFRKLRAKTCTACASWVGVCARAHQASALKTQTLMPGLGT